MKTTAQKIADLFENDGTVFETILGFTLADVCDRQNGEKDLYGEDWTYTFPDGSSLVGNSNAWDIGGKSGDWDDVQC